ncbi:MAG: hypothetical protein Q9225_002075 [Loekoesia sp. 1 TL-2023]
MTPYGPSVAASRNQEPFDNIPALSPKPFSDPSRLAPGDAFFAPSPPRLPGDVRTYTRPINGTVDADPAVVPGRRRREKDRGRSGSRRGKGVWKKLLWVKQPKYPDNYTDPPTFLSHLQRNPRLQPYEFWPLVADSTVIVQHLSSVAIFVCCFVGIYQEQVSPTSVVSLGSAAAVLGWVLWDFWVGQVEAAKAGSRFTAPPESEVHPPGLDGQTDRSPSQGHSRPPSRGRQPSGLGLSLPSEVFDTNGSQSRTNSVDPTPSVTSDPSSLSSPLNGQDAFPTQNTASGFYPPTSAFSQRNQQRLATAKSAILICCALLGLSPILKSLTMSTSSDSIWAMSAWLMCINIFFFDYGGGVGVKFPASLSTNAALMSSTVLASRLKSTTHVFSLTLFSIEVFGLFPVFRRHLRHSSWRGHLLLTFALVLGAGAGLGVTLSESGGWQAMLVGMLLWSVGAALGMGGCSWWLIGLQRYKNVVIGPWDPARPVIRAGGWE